MLNMKRSTRYEIVAWTLFLVAPIEFIALWWNAGSSHFISFTLTTIVAIVVELIVAARYMKKSNLWCLREDEFFNLTGCEAPCSYKDLEAMKAMRDGLMWYFTPVKEAMAELVSLKSQRLTHADVLQCKVLEEQIRKDRDFYTQCRMAALPFLTLPYLLPAERKLSEEVNERLRQNSHPQLILFPKR